MAHSSDITGLTGFIDLLALDAEGRVHVLELKRDRTPRDVVAQALDYGSWAKDLSLEELEQIYQDNGEGDTHLDEAFAEHFGGPLPDVVNADQQFTIVASELDATSDRIIEFLAESYDVPINAVFFRHFADGGHEYLARTWLLDPQQVEDKAARPSRRKLRPWNGRDFYVILGRAERGDPRWPIAHKYGFLNAGGGSWYWKPLRNLEPGHRVFAYVSGAGYVGIGRVTANGDPPTRRQRRNRRPTSTAPRSARCERGVEAGRSLGRLEGDRDGRARGVASRAVRRGGLPGERTLQLTGHRLQTARHAHHPDRRIGIRTQHTDQLARQARRSGSLNDTNSCQDLVTLC